jgi:hypothetical protein
VSSEARINDISAREEQRRLSKEELLRPRVYEKDEFIEALGGTVRIRSLTHAMRSEIRQKAGFGTKDWDEDRFTSLGIIFSIVDPKLTEEDVESLRQVDAGVYDELVLRISMMNMLGHQEELGKDSSETPS